MPPEAEFVLGTRCQVNLYRDGTPEIYRAVFARLRELENLFSVNIPGSEISAVNAAAGREAVPVSAEVLDLVEAARFYAEISGGAFDPSVGPLVKLWGIGSDAAPRVPADAEIAGALALVDWRDIVIDRATGTLFLRRAGMALDLGGIAKGYAADEAARILRERGVRRALIDLGGNIYLFGEKEDGAAWKVGVQNPLESRGAALGVLECGGNVSVVTSGVYERFFEAEGRLWHHILSTKDGLPVENGLASVTIVAAASLEADALSTAVFALGYEDGSALLAGLRPAGDPALPQAIFVFANGGIRLTPGLAGRFRLAGADFYLAE